MIPSFDVNVEVDVLVAQLVVLDADGVVSEDLGLNSSYQPFIHVTWEDAAGWLSREKAWFSDAARRARSPEEFEELASEADEASYDWAEHTGDVDHGLDSGVTALVFALAAADFAPVLSCRGHPNKPGSLPQVRVAADPYRVRVLVTLVKQAGCGLVSDEEGFLWIVATSLLPMIELAELIQAAKDRWTALPSAPWRPGLGAAEQRRYDP